MILDYAALAAQAKTLVEGTGRSMTFVLNTEPTALDADTWQDELPDVNVSGSGVAVPPSSAVSLGLSTTGDMVKNSTQIIIAVADSSIVNAREVIDSDSSVWRVTGVETLRPAETTLLYFVGVAR